MGLIDQAKQKQNNEIFEYIASREPVTTDQLMKGVADGVITVMHNTKRPLETARAVGKGLYTKVNANVGTSPLHCDMQEELQKAQAALDAGTDAIMDLSTGGDIPGIRREILKMSTVPVGTVPAYEAVAPYITKGQGLDDMRREEWFEVIERQAEEGVDFMTLHCGINRKTVAIVKKYPRVMGVVSRGGSLLTEWIAKTGKENPLFEDYDRVLELLKKYDVAISLGDGLRPGCLEDATDNPQIEELKELGKLTKRAIEAGVQVIVEGPGHIPVHEVAENIRLQKKYCYGAPFYVLGPIVTDIAPGYDHITSAVGGSIAASSGADFLCYVTRAEHLCLPNAEEVREGVIASRIAAHAGDVSKGVPGAREWDLELSKARRKRDWKKQRELAIDKLRYDELFKRGKAEDVCTMCGEYCSLKTMDRCEEKAGENG